MVCCGYKKSWLGIFSSNCTNVDILDVSVVEKDKNPENPYSCTAYSSHWLLFWKSKSRSLLESLEIYVRFLRDYPRTQLYPLPTPPPPFRSAPWERQHVFTLDLTTLSVSGPGRGSSCQLSPLRWALTRTANLPRHRQPGCKKTPKQQQQQQQ